MSKFSYVIGPPGTGKTTYLSRQIKLALSKYCGDEGSILVCSFTRAAACEITERAGIKPSNQVGTLHSICFNLLNRPKIAELNIKEWNELECQIYQMQKKSDDIINYPYFGCGTFKKNGNYLYLSSQLNRLKMIQFENWEEGEKDFFKKWQKWKVENNFLDFTDLIEICYKGNICPKNNCKVAFIDEAQDFTLLEISLIKKWSKKLDHVVFSGDPDQCIYEFRGSDPQLFVNREKDSFLKVLDKSYRIPKSVKHYSDKLINCINAKRENITYNPANKDGVVSKCIYNIKTFEYEIENIFNFINNGNTVMVIMPSGFDTVIIEKKFKKFRVPYHNPYSSKSMWNPISIGSRTRFDKIISFIDKKRDIDSVILWSKDLNCDVFTDGYGFDLKNKSNNEQEVNILNYFKSEHINFIENGDIDWYFRNIKERKRDIYEYAVDMIKINGIDLVKSPKVILGTIHSVKGGEADIVYVFPNLSRKWYIKSIYGDDKSRDEINRLFYVAFTRAKEKLYLMSPSNITCKTFIPI